MLTITNGEILQRRVLLLILLGRWYERFNFAEQGLIANHV